MLHSAREMRLQSFRSPSRRRFAKRSFLFGSLLLLIALCAGGFLHQAFKYLERLEKRFESLNSVGYNLPHAIHKRSAEEEPLVSTITSPGTAYVRWGRRNCPDKKDTSLVYHGYAAGSYFDHPGGGSDYLCLHHNVTYTSGHYVEGEQGLSYLYGVEYRDGPSKYPLFELSLIEQRKLQYQGVPCALCLVRSPTTLMIPSREKCDVLFARCSELYRVVLKTL